MAGEPQIVIVGNVTRDPETRDAGGATVTRIGVAVSNRKFNRDSNEWVDEEPTFWDVSAWRDLGVNLAASVGKGSRIVVTGKLLQRKYEKDGQQRTAFEIEAEDVGVSVRFATVSATKTGGNHTQQNRHQQVTRQGAPANTRPAAPAYDDRIPF